MRGSLCRKQPSTLINCHRLLHGRLSIVAYTPPVVDPIARYLPRIVIFGYPHVHSMPLLLGSPSEYCVWYRKTRMVWVPDGEKNLTICLFALTEDTNVMDSQTDGQTPHFSIGHAYA